MAEHDAQSGLLKAYDELTAVERGLWGVMSLLCDDRTTVSIDTGCFHFMVEPLLIRLAAANDLLDWSRKQAFPQRTGGCQPPD